MIVVVMGLPGSGKSHLAMRLAALIGADHISSDKLRSALFRVTNYSDKGKLSVYEEMLNQAETSLNQGKNVVLDATFYKDAIREKFKNALDPFGHVIFIEVVAGDNLVEARLKQPRLDSDANYDVFREIKEQWQPLSSPHLVVRSTNDNIDNMLDEAVAYLQYDINDKTGHR
jgi:predicted kinase